MVEENLAVIIRFAETVRGGMQLLMVHIICNSQRIQIGMQVTAHPVGPDHHNGAHRIPGCAVNLGIGQFGPIFAHPLRDFLADSFRHGFGRHFTPVAVKSGDPFSIHLDRPVGPFPRSPAGVGFNVLRRIIQLGEELFPLRVD